MTENGKEKTTFSSRLKEKRLEKGWSQHDLASRAGCTNPNISYLESHPEQKPKMETVEALAAALGWPINEALRLAGYRESDDNLTRLEIEDDVSQCEEASGTAGSDGIPEIELDDLDELIEE